MVHCSSGSIHVLLLVLLALQRHFADAFFCDPPRALNAQLLPAVTPEEKAVVFLDYPNEHYKTEFLHL